MAPQDFLPVLLYRLASIRYFRERTAIVFCLLLFLFGTLPGGIESGSLIQLMFFVLCFACSPEF